MTSALGTVLTSMCIFLLTQSTQLTVIVLVRRCIFFKQQTIYIFSRQQSKVNTFRMLNFQSYEYFIYLPLSAIFEKIELVQSKPSY